MIDTDEQLTVDDDFTADGTPIDEQLADLRGLVISGGKPYILIVLEDPETGGVAVTSQGLGAETDLPRAFREIADLMEAKDCFVRAALDA